MAKKTRYAIYYSPEPESPLWRFGSRWLGYDSATGDEMKRLKIKGLDERRVAEITATARGYGFHATLKPPFRLAKGYDRAMLDEALEAFVSSHAPFKVPGLEIADLDGFLAFRPKKPSPELEAFAAECVQAFDDFRAPPTEAELEKRLKADLSKSQKALLEKWGYPYVMEAFRFHMTLTDRLEKVERKAVQTALTAQAKEDLDAKAWVLDTITLMRQKDAGEPFQVVKCYPLTKPAKTRWPLKKKKS